jgi:glutamyl-tRNA synthetase
MEYEALGYLPDAMVNFLARLGWSHGDAEIFSRDELVQWFDLAHISPSPSRFDTGKLRWVNHEHLKRLQGDELGRRLVPYLERAGLDAATGPDPAQVAMLVRDRVATFAEMADAAHYFYATPHPSREKVAAEVNAANRPALAELLAEFETLEWTREAIVAALKTAAARHSLKPPQVMMPLRLIVCGMSQTPAIDAVLALLGRDVVRSRLANGLSIIGQTGDFG